MDLLSEGQPGLQSELQASQGGWGLLPTFPVFSHSLGYVMQQRTSVS